MPLSFTENTNFLSIEQFRAIGRQSLCEGGRETRCCSSGCVSESGGTRGRRWRWRARRAYPGTPLKPGGRRAPRRARGAPRTRPARRTTRGPGRAAGPYTEWGAAGGRQMAAEGVRHRLLSAMEGNAAAAPAKGSSTESGAEAAVMSRGLPNVRLGRVRFRLGRIFSFILLVCG